MHFDIKLITDWRFLVPASVALLSLAFSVFNFLVGKLVASKIMNNDIKHLTLNVKDLKDKDRELRVDLKNDLEKIFRRLGKIDKAIAVRKAICDERHSKDK